MSLSKEDNSGAVGIIGADKNAVVTAHAMKANADISLNGLEHMTEVNVDVCIGEGGSDKNLAWVHLNILKLVGCISGNYSASR